MCLAMGAEPFGLVDSQVWIMAPGTGPYQLDFEPGLWMLDAVADWFLYGLVTYHQGEYKLVADAYQLPEVAELERMADDGGIA